MIRRQVEFFRKINSRGLKLTDKILKIAERSIEKLMRQQVVNGEAETMH